MSWHGSLDLHYSRQGAATRAHDRHEGPLRVLKALYPEGEAVCHHTLVHPPGGVAGGDVLSVTLQLDAGTHALLTTPGATRFYRSAGPMALQQLHARVAPGARLEWLPLENIVHDGAWVHNAQTFELAPGAQMLAWDTLALGLPSQGRPWRQGRFRQTLALPGVWLEQGQVDAEDALLLASPLGWDGRRVLATMWWAGGEALPAAEVDQALEAARELLAQHPGVAGGVTAPHRQVVVLRALADRVEPLMQLLVATRRRWRTLAWGLSPQDPRVWAT